MTCLLCEDMTITHAYYSWILSFDKLCPSPILAAFHSRLRGRLPRTSSAPWPFPFSRFRQGHYHPFFHSIVSLFAKFLFSLHTSLTRGQLRYPSYYSIHLPLAFSSLYNSILSVSHLLEVIFSPMLISSSIPVKLPPFTSSSIIVFTNACFLI